MTRSIGECLIRSECETIASAMAEWGYMVRSTRGAAVVSEGVGSGVCVAGMVEIKKEAPK